MLTTEEKVQNAIRWVDALLTTEHAQGYGRLGSEKIGFCCIGLGCYTLNIDFKARQLQNEDFAENVGLNTPIGRFIDGDKSNSLLLLNDSERMSFIEIGKIIQSNPEMLFEEDVSKGLSKYWRKL